jgi:hypothetical protein
MAGWKGFIYSFYLCVVKSVAVCQQGREWLSVDTQPVLIASRYTPMQWATFLTHINPHTQEQRLEKPQIFELPPVIPPWLHEQGSAYRAQATTASKSASFIFAIFQVRYACHTSCPSSHFDIGIRHYLRGTTSVFVLRRTFHLCQGNLFPESRC